MSTLNPAIALDEEQAIRRECRRRLKVTLSAAIWQWTVFLCCKPFDAFSWQPTWEGFLEGHKVRNEPDCGNRERRIAGLPPLLAKQKLRLMGGLD